ncbi:MAG TPA: hypothetical protein VMX13_18695 [Sedimentisphaerales bacterium]|nr:hypothetical protein [Sedimentisphaerales bacterium]
MNAPIRCQVETPGTAQHRNDGRFLSAWAANAWVLRRRGDGPAAHGVSGVKNLAVNECDFDSSADYHAR